MFGLDWNEILVIAMVAILVVGPKDLPRLMRTVGQWVAKIRRMASHFQAGVDEMIRQAELEDLRKDLNAMKRDLNRPVEMDPRTTTTPPPANLLVQSDPPEDAPPPPAAAPAPAANADLPAEPKILPPQKAAS